MQLSDTEFVSKTKSDVMALRKDGIRRIQKHVRARDKAGLSTQLVVPIIMSYPHKRITHLSVRTCGIDWQKGKGEEWIQCDACRIDDLELVDIVKVLNACTLRENPWKPVAKRPMPRTWYERCILQK